MIKVSKDLIAIPLSTVMPSQSFALLSVAPVYNYIDGKRTDQLVGWRFSLADPETFQNFDVRLNATKTPITQEMIDASELRFYVTLDNAMVKPYAINYGKAECTVTCDSVKLVKD